MKFSKPLLHLKKKGIMYQQSKLSSLLRYISLLLLFYIPALMSKQLIPIHVLPLVVFGTCFLTHYIIKKAHFHFKVLITSFFILIFCLFIPFIPAYLFQSIFYNKILLHYRVSFWFISCSVLFSLTTSIVFYYYSKWVKIEPLFFICILIIFFWYENSHSLYLFKHPFHKSLFSLIFLLLQLFRLTVLKEKKSNNIFFFLVFSPLLAIIYFFTLGPYNAASVSSNGGLMQPTLFRFDFSPFLTLQNEIKINDSLVFIVQAPLEYSSHFLRRIYLSGWDLKKGFYESPAPNDFPQQTKVPSAFTEFETQPFQLRHLVSQNIFVVNFDPESLIAFDYPVLVRPYEVWNSASFSGAYSVTSNTSDFFPFELFESPKPFINQNFSKEAFEFYTRIDTHTKNLLLPLTEKITQHVPVYYDKIVALNNFLKNGEYKYSLKPGIAEDGNQLSHFLFKSKKGYCTYYAFSLALMLRSIGIPARVAAGFFLQPDLATLNYFPIRANMAHAWVEVFFNDYG